LRIITFLVTGNGDVAYNPQKKILGAISLSGEIAYHLFSIDTNASKNENVVKLCRKSKWYPQYESFEGTVATILILFS
jgi:hypothetical protein